MPPANALSLRMQITRWIVLQKARCHRINRLQLLVRTQFQVLFHSPSGVLLTFPSRYLFSIDRKIYLALEGGPPSFSQSFTCSDLLDNLNDKVSDSSHTRLSLSMAKLSNLFWLLRKFLTLCMMVVAHAAFCESWTSPVSAKGYLGVTTPYRYSSINLFAQQ
jgi:hypothetical protein